MEHQSVLLNETIEMLNVKEDGIYIDCTLGRGGHSAEILKRCRKGHVYGLDRDKQALKESQIRLSAIGDNFTCIHTDFGHMKEALAPYGVVAADGILMDLGVSSPQFDDAKRGFSYRFDARLDMRMDQSQSLDAWEVVNTYSLEELTRIFKEYGEDPHAYRIAQGILKARGKKSIDTTFQLVDVIKENLPAKVLHQKGHPAKQIFQAIRIEVNQEMAQLEMALKEAMELLAPEGILAVITFHSLEDRLVKNTFKKVAVQKKVDRRLPQLGIEKLEYELISRKPVTATQHELDENRRAHSAKLRGLKKKGGAHAKEET